MPTADTQVPCRRFLKALAHLRCAPRACSVGDLEEVLKHAQRLGCTVSQRAKRDGVIYVIRTPSGQIEQAHVVTHLKGDHLNYCYVNEFVKVIDRLGLCEEPE